MSETRTWTLNIPAPGRMYTDNTGSAASRWETGPVVKRWREASYLYAINAKLPKGLHRVRLDVCLHPVTNHNRDALNLHKFVVKPLVDGLGPERRTRTKTGIRVDVGYGLVPDDNPTHVEGPFPTIGPVVDKRRYPYGLAVVTITELPAGEAP